MISDFETKYADEVAAFQRACFNQPTPSDPSKMIQSTEKQVKEKKPQWKDDRVKPFYDFGEPFITWDEYMQLPWEMMRWHNWYMEASRKAVLYVNAKIPADMQEQMGGAPLVMVDFRDVELVPQGEIGRTANNRVDPVSVLCLVTIINISVTCRY